MVAVKKEEARACPSCGWPLVKGFPPLEVSVDGTLAVINNVPGWICRGCGEVVRDLEDIMEAKAVVRLDRLGLYPNDLPAALMLFAPSSGKQTTPIPGKTVFQKLLWYFVQQTESHPSLPRPQFIPMQLGPWDPNLDRRLSRFRAAGLLQEKARIGPDQKEYFEYALSPEGIRKLGVVWDSVPRSVKEVASQVKSQLGGMNSKQIVDKVHHDYPEMWDKSRAERWAVTERTEENP